MTNPQEISFEKLAQDHWTDAERTNAATVVEFFQTLMNNHDFSAIKQRFGEGAYTQHNRAIPDQIDGLLGYVKSLVRRFPDYGFDVKRIVSSGDIVVLHSHATLKAKHRGDETKGFIITDTFRLEDGQLAEHWDAIQAIDFGTRLLMLLTGGAVKNSNSTF